MSRSLHNIKGREAIKTFIKFGGIERKGKGDHINIKMPNGMIITIPGNKVVKITSFLYFYFRAKKMLKPA